MTSFINYISRHNKVFRRDTSLVFFSLLSVLIVIILYALFLQKTQVDAIEQVVPASAEIKTMVNEWMVAGLLSMIAVTTTLGAFGIYVKDIESKVLEDFLTTPSSRITIQLSYIANAWIIGFILSVIAFLACELFIVIMGGEWLSFASSLKVIGLLALSVTLSSTINLFFTFLVKTQSAFSTISTIVGTAIGFLCGVYVPMVALPDFMQKVIMFFPISHTTVLLRDVLTEKSIAHIFIGNIEAANTYKLNFGITYELNNQVINHSTSYLFIIVTIILFTLISSLLFAKKTN